MDEAQRTEVIERVRRERVAQGLPEMISDEGFHRLVGHVLATQRERERASD